MSYTLGQQRELELFVFKMSVTSYGKSYYKEEGWCMIECVGQVPAGMQDHLIYNEETKPPFNKNNKKNVVIYWVAFLHLTFSQWTYDFLEIVLGIIIMMTLVVCILIYIDVLHLKPN